MRIKLSSRILIPFLVLLLSACALKQPELINTSWKLTELNGKNLPAQVQITLMIKDGEAGGNAACNAYGSTFTQSGDVLTFTEIFSTMMYCEDVSEYEMEYLAALGSVRTFQLKDGLLYLQDEKRTTVLLFAGS